MPEPVRGPWNLPGPRLPKGLRCRPGDDTTEDPGWDTEYNALGYTPSGRGHWEMCLFTTPSMMTIETTLPEQHWASTALVTRMPISGHPGPLIGPEFTCCTEKSRSFSESQCIQADVGLQRIWTGPRCPVDAD
jgi:hypothetical protein